MEIHGYVLLNLAFQKEDDLWLGECLELGTATFGDTLEEAKDRLKETALLHLDTLEDVGERERFFKEHNIKFYPRKPRRHSFKVPTSPSRNLFIHPHIRRIPAVVGG